MAASKKNAQAGSGTLSAADAKVQAEVKMAKWLEVMDQTERMSVGTFYNIPKDFMDWHFMRCGIRNQPRAEALAATMREMGYQTAPKGVRMAGFESDGEGGLYLCIPVQIFYALQERKEKMRKRHGQNIDSMVQGHAAQLRGMMGSGSEVSVKGRTDIK